MAGAIIIPPLVIEARDSSGRLVPGFTGAVTIAIGVNPGGGTLSGTTTVIAVGGKATFSDLSIDRSGERYRLLATAAGLTATTSTRFDILPGPAIKLGFTVPPNTTKAGAGFSPAVQVSAQDVYGNTAAAFTGAVTVAITGATGTPGATLAGTKTVTAVAGAATFTDVTIDKVGSGYTLSATTGGLTETTSAPFDITPGTTTQLAFTVSPSDATAGATFAPAVQVTVRDALGNTATGFLGNVTVAITAGTGTGGATLSGTKVVTAVAGVATFSDLSINRSGSGYTLSATSSGLAGTTSASFNINAGAATQLAFAVQPATSAAGATITPAVQVAARDAMGNADPTFTGDVTLAIGANPGGGTLAGTKTVAAVAGVATFGDLSIDLTGVGYRLVATSASWSATSGAFSITAATATQLAFTVQPGTTTAGNSINPAVKVAARDALGNLDPAFTGNVTVIIEANPGSGTLAGTTTAAAVAGVATFSNLSINRSGTGYTLAASAGGLSGTTSAPFDVTPGAAIQLAFTVQPTNTTAGTTPTPAVQVTVRDALGNAATSYLGNVTVDIVAGTGTSGANLFGTTTVTAVAGVATFPDLYINKSGTGYRLSAKSSGLAGATSVPFDVAPGEVTRLVFAVQPGNSTAGATISPPVQVAARDSLGNTNPGYAGNVTIAIGVNPGTGSLSGTKTVAAVAGIATFGDLSIDQAGTGYRLLATSGSLSVTSGAFSITAVGSATQLVFTVQPTTTIAGSLISPAVKVTARDGFGNTDPGFTGNVTVAIETNPGSGTLSGPTTVPAVAGVATFSSLSIDRVGSGYTLAASADAMTGTTSTPFSITPRAATQLVFTVQPSTTTAGATITPAVQVTVRDALGNTATSFLGNVTVDITAGTGTSGANLFGSTTVTVVAGVATFSDLYINKSGTAYTLSATSSGLAAATSTAFDIDIGAVTQLVFTVQPATTTAGATITPAVQVTARDAVGNTNPGFTGNVTMAIGVNPGTGTLSGTKTVAAVAGTATFGNLSIDLAGVGYRLLATSGTLSATSGAFSITGGAATQLAFTVQPTATPAGRVISPAVKVTARDALGNTDPNFSADVTVAIGTNPVGGTLAGTKTVAAVAGVATFSDLSIDRVGSGYTLSAAASSLTGATSASFAITTGSATQLVFTVQPGTTTAGVMITPAVQVTARDAQGNTATGFTNNVTVAITAGTGTAGAALSGTKTVAAVGGIATFSDISIDKNGTGYKLSATASGLVGATSTAFNIDVGPVTHLVFTVQPVTTTAGTILTPPVQVSARDAMGNTNPGFTNTVTMAIGANPGNGTLSGTKTVAAVGGVATFGNLSIDLAGVGYRLLATSGGLSATSGAFSITAGAATRLAFTVQPTTSSAASIISPAVKVAARDAYGNTATGFTGGVTVAIQTNPASGTLSGTKTVTAVAGVATFSDLSIDKVGVGYALSAAATGLTGATSVPFDITPAAATQLVFTVQPVTTTAGATIAPAVQVTARDAQGNTATGYTSNVSMSIGTNPANGTLSGIKTVAAVGGVATFSNLSIDKSGVGYRLSATASGLVPATSAVFNINAAPVTELVFAVQPATTAAGATITPAVQVAARDSLGNISTAFTANVTMAIAVNPPGNGTLSGTKTVAAVNGVATFSNLSIDLVGTGYRLLATSGSLSVTSGAFSITGGAATRLAFTVQPTTSSAAEVISPAVKVTAQDALGNTASGFTGNVTVAIQTNPAGGTLAGTKTVAAVAGVATFSDLSINKVGAGYTLSAAASGLTGAASASFDITPAAATQLAFTVQPVTTTAGATITPSVQVTVRDALGNTATGFLGNVTVDITPGSGTSGANLFGTRTVTAIGGVANFSDLNITKSGTGYTLSATSSGLAGATSAAFNINAGTVTQLVFAVQPVNTASGAAINPAVQVAARDAMGNTNPGFTANVTMTIGVNPSGGTLSGTTTVAAVAGVATFGNLRIDVPGTGYRLLATSGSLNVTSGAFSITAGAATHLEFTVQPTTSSSAQLITPAVKVAARDALGNTDPGFTGNVTVAIQTNPASGTLAGTKTVAAVAGVATFSDLSIDKAGTGYALSAANGGLTGATSAPFDITPAAASQLVFTVQPVTTTAGVTIAPAIKVTARDAQGNTATGYTSNVTMAIGANPATGTLSGTKVVAAVAGVATFADLSINRSGTGYTLSATASGLVPGASASFNINPGAVRKLTFTAQPSDAVAGANIAPPVQVTAQDSLGNTVTTFTSNVTVVITPGTGTGGATLSGTALVAAVSGIATFSTLNIDKSGTGYKLTATSNGLTPDTSASFAITAGPATQLDFTVQPVTTTAGGVITPAVQVTARDALGNPARTFTGDIVVEIEPGTGTPSGMLSGTKTVAAVLGVSTFSDLSINQAATGYRLRATSTGLTAATSNAFSINP